MTDLIKAEEVLICVHCKREHKSKGGLPRGWKRNGKQVICAACWSDRYMLRAITIPVAGPESPEEWPKLRTALAGAWGDTTRLANWLMTEQIKADRVRKPEDTKLWPAPNPYLYPHARLVCPNLSPAAVVAICNLVQRKYNTARLDVIWRGAASLPSFRYPMPYPVPAQAWSASYLHENVPAISVTLQGERFCLRLRGGHEFRPQLAAFAQLINETAVPCELALYRVTSHSSNHRPEEFRSRIMAKLVMWLPKPAVRERSGQMLLSRGADCLVIAKVTGRTDWRLNADFVQTWIVGHAARLQRISEDTKYEKRWPKEKRENINNYRAEICIKQNHRLDNFIHTAAGMLVNVAQRANLAEVVYDETATSYLPKFPWFSLAEKLRYKLAEQGIRLTVLEASSLKKLE